MKAKKVYEFIQKKSLKKSIGSIGTNFKFEQEVKEYLLDFAYEDTINNIKIEYNYKERSIKLDLFDRNQSGFLTFIFNKPITKLPFKIYTNVSIELYTENTEIKEFEIDIESSSYLFISFENNLEKLNGNIKVSSLSVEDNTLTEWPENIILENIEDTDALDKLPNNLTVTESLYIGENSYIKEIGDNLKAKNLIIRHNYTLEKIGKNAIIENLEIKYSQIKELPDDITVTRKYDCSGILPPKTANITIFNKDENYDEYEDE